MKPEVVCPQAAQVTISVIIPFYNSERYIEECIEALLSQNYPSTGYEVIMIDNNSTDGSAAIARQYPRIKLLSEQKQGAYAARNLGVAAAQGEIIAFTDSDCIPATDWLRGIKVLMTNSAADIVLGLQESGKDSPLLRILDAYENEKNKYVFTSMKKQLYYGHTNNMAVRKALFKELGPFVEIARGSDSILVRRCVDKRSCKSVVYSPSIRVRHMEIDSAWKYFKKMFTYGRSLQTYGKIANARSITNRERLFIFRQTIKNQNYSWIECIALFGVLSAGFLYWLFGCIEAACRWNPRTKS